MDKEKKVRSKQKFAWSPQQEQILKTWGEASACYRYMHNHAFLIYKKQNMHFSLPVIILSTVTGTANFAQSSLPASIRGAAPSMIGGYMSC